MNIHPRLVGGLVSLVLIIITIMIDKFFHTDCYSNEVVIFFICLIGGIIAFIIAKKNE